MDNDNKTQPNPGLGGWLFRLAYVEMHINCLCKSSHLLVIYLLPCVFLKPCICMNHLMWYLIIQKNCRALLFGNCDCIPHLAVTIDVPYWQHLTQPYWTPLTEDISRGVVLCTNLVVYTPISCASVGPHLRLWICWSSFEIVDLPWKRYQDVAWGVWRRWGAPIVWFLRTRHVVFGAQVWIPHDFIKSCEIGEVGYDYIYDSQLMVDSVSNIFHHCTWSARCWSGVYDVPFGQNRGLEWDVDFEWDEQHWKLWWCCAWLYNVEKKEAFFSQRDIFWTEKRLVGYFFIKIYMFCLRLYIRGLIFDPCVRNHVLVES